jgi:hypothetical protein
MVELAKSPRDVVSPKGLNRKAVTVRSVPTKRGIRKEVFANGSSVRLGRLELTSSGWFFQRSGEPMNTTPHKYQREALAALLKKV